MDLLWHRVWLSIFWNQHRADVFVYVPSQVSNTESCILGLFMYPVKFISPRLSLGKFIAVSLLLMECMIRSLVHSTRIFHLLLVYFLPWLLLVVLSSLLAWLWGFWVLSLLQQVHSRLFISLSLLFIRCVLSPLFIITVFIISRSLTPFVWPLQGVKW